MKERASSSDPQGGSGAAQAAVAPWLQTLADLEPWLHQCAGAIWPEGGDRPAAELLALLRETLAALARGEDAIPCAASLPRSAVDPQRIDTLLATRHRAGQAPSAQRAGQRRKAVLDLALWHALRGLGDAASGPTRPSTVAQLHAALALPTPPATGVSPAPAYAATDAARRFFDVSVRRVLEALAGRLDGDGRSYASAIPSEPFDGGLPSLVAWSHAWSVAVAGVYLDHLHRLAGADVAQALRDVWSGRFDAVRFRAGAGLTALPTRAGGLHLDLWTCVVKAQALAFGAARWPAYAAGTRRHGVRIDMHELSGGARPLAKASAQQLVPSGVSVESLYRAVFIDRLHAVVERTDEPASHSAEHSAEHSIAIDMDRPRNGHWPNLKLVLRWRDPQAQPLRFAASHAEADAGGAGRAAVQRWLASQGDDVMASVLPGERLDWQADPAPPRFVDDRGDALMAIGHGALWHAVDPAVQWIDPDLVVCVDGVWYELPVVLHEDDGPRDEAAVERTWWLVRDSLPLPAGLDAASLRRAAQCPQALHCVAHQAGLGAFVMVAIDVDAWRRAPQG
jgi:hypothetical protein